MEISTISVITEEPLYFFIQDPEGGIVENPAGIWTGISFSSGIGDKHLPMDSNGYFVIDIPESSATQNAVIGLDIDSTSFKSVGALPYAIHIEQNQFFWSESFTPVASNIFYSDGINPIGTPIDSARLRLRRSGSVFYAEWTFDRKNWIEIKKWTNIPNVTYYPKIHAYVQENRKFYNPKTYNFY